MKISDIHQKLVARFGDRIKALVTEAIDPWIEVAPAAMGEIAAFLKQDSDLAFDSLNDLCGVDYFDADAKKLSKLGWEPHVEVVYHLYSFTHKHALVVKALLPRWKNNAAGELPEIPTVSHVWAVADWHEREAFDLVGIHFIGHENLRRILTSEDWEGHPLRKDYEFPLEYHGIRGK